MDTIIKENYELYFTNNAKLSRLACQRICTSLAVATVLALALSLVPGLYIVFLFRENWVPGISMEQENIVWRGKEEDMMVVTDTSYSNPLLAMVVVVSPICCS